MRRGRSRWRINTVRSATFLAGATLDMGFARGAYLGATPSQFAASLRGSDGYAEDEVGNWSLFGSGVARVTNKGLLVEEARTNSIRNNSMQGAVAGVIGSGGALPTNWGHAGGSTAGLTCTIVGTGTELGVDYVDIRYSGTTSSTSIVLQFEGSGIIAASAGQVWFCSVFAKLASGSFTNVTNKRFSLLDTGGTGSTTSSDQGITSSLLRFSHSMTTAGGTTAVRPQFEFVVTNTAAVDFTIRIGWPQIELGAFATSPIRTTSGAVTRAADAVSLTGANFTSWYTAGAGTIFAEYVMSGASTAGRVFSLSDGTTSNLIEFYGGGPGSNVMSSQVTAAAVSRFNSLPGGYGGIGSLTKTAHGFAVADYAAVANGNVPGTVTGSTAGALPTGLNVAHFGNRALLDRQYNGYIRRVAYFPTRLSNAELQAITT